MAVYEKYRSQKGFYKSILDITRGMTFHAHLHTSFELFYVFRGTVFVRVEQEEYSLKEGQSILILPNLIHEYRSDGADTLSQLAIFSVEYLPEIFREGESGLFRYPISELAEEDFRRLIDAQEDHYLFRAALYRIAARYAKNAPIPLAAERNGNFALWLSDYLENHFKEKIDEKSVAKAMGYHPRYLSLLINQNFGVSFKTLLNEYRIRAAQQLLTDKKKSITQVYTDAGFESQNTFNRNFKLFTGVTPREYRNKNRP